GEGCQQRQGQNDHEREGLLSGDEATPHNDDAGRDVHGTPEKREGEAVATSHKSKRKPTKYQRKRQQQKEKLQRKRERRRQRKAKAKEQAVKGEKEDGIPTVAAPEKYADHEREGLPRGDEATPHNDDAGRDVHGTPEKRDGEAVAASRNAERKFTKYQRWRYQQQLKLYRRMMERRLQRKAWAKEQAVKGEKEDGIPTVAAPEKYSEQQQHDTKGNEHNSKRRTDLDIHDECNFPTLCDNSSNRCVDVGNKGAYVVPARRGGTSWNASTASKIASSLVELEEWERRLQMQRELKLQMQREMVREERSASKSASSDGKAERADVGGGIPWLISAGQDILEIPHDVTCVHIAPSSSVKKLGSRAFYRCERLVEVTLGKGLKQIDVRAFQDCKSLKRFNFQVPSTVKKICREAFRDCYELEEMELCEGLQEIDYSAFNGCKSLQRMKIPFSVKLIGDFAFRACERLVEVEFCEGGLEEIGSNSFHGCVHLQRINMIPSTVKVIGREAFCGCERLEYVGLREGLETIEQSAFSGCKSLRSMTIPSSVTKIAARAFLNCEQLMEVELREGLEEVGDNAFYGCKSLRSMEVPTSVKEIGVWAFKDCRQLENVELRYGLEDVGYGAFEDQSLQYINALTDVQVIGRDAHKYSDEPAEVDMHEGMGFGEDGSIFNSGAKIMGVHDILFGEGGLFNLK
ncbi:hypothetical protein ACHAWF_008088, partial [Thalassiosira exigua]